MKTINALLGQIPSSLGWLVHIAIIVGIGFLGYFVKKIVYSRLFKHAEKSTFNWDSALVGASSVPLTVAIWLIVTNYSILAIQQEFKAASTLFHPILMGIELVSIVLVTWTLYRFVQIYEERLLKTAGANQDEATRIDIISKLLRVGFFLITALIVLQFFGIPVTGIVAFGSAGALVVGLAGKEILANFFGGVMIYFDRPFKVGDWIRSPDREIEGIVEHIGLRLTRIRTFDRRPLYLPNSAFSSIAVINPSRMSNRRIKTDIGIRYSDALKMGQIVQDVRQMLNDHPDIDQRRYKMVHFLDFGPSSLNFQIYTFTKTTNWEIFRDVQQDVFLKIIDIIDSHNAEIAFPTQTLHIENDPSEQL